MQTRRLLLICVLSGLLATAGCMTMPTPDLPPTTTSGTLAHQYGEEILAYMMQVVLGRSGDPDRRTKWASRGLDQPLDFQHINSIMSDPGGNKTAIMINDPNILGLSKVLYHYAPEMSQFSGRYATSLYPASELVALRLFVLQRIRDNRKISIQSLLDHRELLQDSRRQPTLAEMAAMHATMEETLLLQAVFKSKPWLFNSLTNPFLVDAFANAGVLTEDALTRALIARAHYRKITCMPMGKTADRDSIVIAFLPSMTKEFNPDDTRFSPTEVYESALWKLKKDILAACRHIAMADRATVPVVSGGKSDPLSESRLDQHLERKIAFRTLNSRPLVIYPSNAARVIRETCPEADLAVIILGRNVYQAMHINPETDVFPATNRVYFDISDVIHSQVSSEINDISRLIYERLKPGLPDA